MSAVACRLRKSGQSPPGQIQASKSRAAAIASGTERGAPFTFLWPHLSAPSAMPEPSIISIRLPATAGKAEGLKVATLEPQLGHHSHRDDVVYRLGKAFDAMTGRIRGTSAHPPALRHAAPSNMGDRGGETVGAGCGDGSNQPQPNRRSRRQLAAGAVWSSGG
jgi:hypothetical protein